MSQVLNRPPLAARKSRYAADGLTIDWFDQPHPNDTRWPYPLPDWWGTNRDGRNGVSYCILNATDEKHVAAIRAQLTDLTRGPAFEVLEFQEDLTMAQLFPYCTYKWVMQIHCDTPKSVPSDYSPKISIIMGTFRRQHTIGRTVQTLLDQDYQNWELIVINNEPSGRVDLPPDPRIAIYEHSDIANPCYAKNCGYQYVTGDLVCAFDDDNDMLPGYLAKMAAGFVDPEVYIVHCGMRLPGNICDFSFDTQEAWLRAEYATPTWREGSLVHDQLYYRGIIADRGWERRNIVQLGEVLIQARTDPKGGMREGGC